METNLTELFNGMVEFLGILVPGVLAYAILFYSFREVLTRLTPQSRTKSAIGGESPGPETSNLNTVFILLQVYVLGFIILGLSGVFNLLPDAKVLNLLPAAIRENLPELETAFTDDPPPECKDLAKRGLVSGDSYEWAREYIYLKDRDGTREIDQLRAEYKVCRSVSFLSTVIFVVSLVSLWFRKRMPKSSDASWIASWKVVVLSGFAAMSLFAMFMQLKLESRKATFRTALILKGMPPEAIGKTR